MLHIYFKQIQKLRRIKVYISFECLNPFFSFKECSKNLFDTRSTSNAIGVMNSSKHQDVLGQTYPPTPCMIGYRQSSLPNLLPTCVTKHPKTFNDLFKQSDVDHCNA